jgi:hypothetical protein
MFSLRAVRASGARTAPSNLARAFTTSTPYSKTPSLADLTPEGVESFDSKQRAFRQKLSQQQKQKDASQFRSTSSPAPTAPSASNASLQSQLDSVASGSYSSSSTEATSAATGEQESGKRKGALSSLIYGTKEGREMEQEMEQSFSQVLARGKYVHSIVFHNVKPDKVDEYVDLVGNWYPKMAAMPENKVHLVGSWRTEVGDAETFGEPATVSVMRRDNNHGSSHLGIPTIPRIPSVSPPDLHSP